jgi:hypothetical protein
MTERERDVELSRRENLSALLGVLGGAVGVAAMTGCAETAGATPATESTGRVAQALSTGMVASVNTVQGDLANSFPETLGLSLTNGFVLVVAMGYAYPGDGGGGLFYWNASGYSGSSTPTPLVDDGGTVLVPGAGIGLSAVGIGCWVRIYSGALNVKWFGAAGDGQADDTFKIMAAIAAVQSQGSGCSVFFPWGAYRVTQTLVCTNPSGMSFVGQMGVTNDRDDTPSNSRIFWDGSSTSNPLFYFSAGKDVEFRNLVLDGKNQSSSSAAGACVWVDEDHQSYRFYGCKFIRAAIGVRVCSAWNTSTNPPSWTPGTSAFNGAQSDPNARLLGGYASDNHLYESCFFDCTVSGLSIESAQALNMLVSKCVFGYNNQGQYGVFLAACQGITLDTVSFLGAAVAEICVLAEASTGNIVVINAHQEGGAGVLFQCINPTAVLGNGIVFQTCGGGNLIIGGGSGSISIKGSILAGVTTVTGGVGLSVSDSTLDLLAKTAGTPNGPLLKLENTTVVAVSGWWNGYDNVVLMKTSLPGWSQLANTSLKLQSAGYLPSLLLGPVNSNSASGMEGASLYSDGAGFVMGVGCYLSQSGTWTASSSAGSMLALNSSGITVDVFDGATVGQTPTFTSVLGSSEQLLSLPRAASDPAFTPGALYYNTVSQTIRICDGAGWRSL